MSRPTLSHWSKQPLERVQPARNEPGVDPDRLYFAKPNGLWVSVDGEGDWPAHCRSTAFNLDDLAYRNVITLHDPERLLWLTTADALDEFQQEYGIDRSISRFGPPRHAIEWDRVAAKYPGMIIAPYQWSQRMALIWYYGWDCASGCIWDPQVIAGVECVEFNKKPSRNLSHERRERRERRQ
jgi:hypothetical protein